jgi:N-acetylglucosamine-6-phosphate deacetylase
MGLPEGRYTYNGVDYESRKGTARYFDGTLVGTSLGLNKLLERFIRFSGCSLNAGIKAVTENPARVLGIQNRKGKIEVGKDADLVILDGDWSVWSTIVEGKVVFHK